MRSCSMLVMALVVPSLLMSQELPRPELGFRSGIVHRSTGGLFNGTEASTAVVISDGPFGSGGGFHYLFFPSPRFGVEPQVGLMRLTSDGDTFQLLTLGAQVNAFLGPDATRAPYVFGIFRSMAASSTGSSTQTNNAIGLGFGFRRVIREALAIRYEGRFLSWSGDGDDATEIAFLISLGAVIRR
jgi:hypothetical protein